MPLETATYITDLVATNPAHTDQVNQGDSHIKLIKSALKATFPNFTSAALASTQAQIDTLVTGTAPSHSQFRGAGLIPCGAYVDFAKQPSRFTSGAVAAGGQAAVDYIECDGSVYNFSDFPDLGAFLGSTYGGNGTTTFGVPNLKDTGRYRRSRTATVTVGTYQANQNASHTHTVTSTGYTDVQGAHSHNAGVTDPGHTHTTSFQQSIGAGGGGSSYLNGGGSTVALGSSLAATGITVSIDTQGNHSHNLAITSTAAASGGTEARPESVVVVSCLKT